MKTEKYNETSRRFLTTLLLMLPLAIYLQYLFWWGFLPILIAFPLAFLFLDKIRKNTRFFRTSKGAILITLIILTAYTVLFVGDYKPFDVGDWPNYSAYAYGLLDQEIFKGDEAMPYAYKIYANHIYAMAFLLLFMPLEVMFILIFILTGFFSILGAYKLFLQITNDVYISFVSAFIVALGKSAISIVIFGGSATTQMISMPFIIWGFYFLLKKRHFYSGAFLGIAFNVQPALAIISAIILLAATIPNRFSGAHDDKGLRPL